MWFSRSTSLRFSSFRFASIVRRRWFSIPFTWTRAKQGVGYITFYYWEVLNPEKMYASLIVVMELGVALMYGLQWLQRRLMSWQR